MASSTNRGFNLVRRLVLLVVATVTGCAAPETGVIGTWHIEISEWHLYLTFKSDGRVERLLIDEDLDQEVSTGTWEIQDSKDCRDGLIKTEGGSMKRFLPVLLLAFGSSCTEWRSQ